MVKAIKYTLRGMNQDITESKVPMQFYYSADNIRFTTDQDVTTGALSFERGNKLQVTLPTITIGTSTLTYTVGSTTKTIVFKPTSEITSLGASVSNHSILGYAVTRDSVIVLSTGYNGDAIWEINNENFDVTLLYLRDLGFSTDNPIQTIFNYENENIQKVYWVDGSHQIRAINIKHNQIEGNSPLMELPVNSINFVGNVNLSQPTITQINSGGNHTSGVIQYAYNLYRLNSSQTKGSPLSELVSLTKGSGQGGGEVNEVVGSTPVVKISNIDTSYTHIKVYAIKYTSYNQAPNISLIEEREIGNNTSITIHDDGTTIADLSLSEFIYLGSNPIVPKHIESKDNILFPINVKEKFFDIDLDMRAFSFAANGVATIWTADDVQEVIADENYQPIKTHDAINKNYDIYKFQKNGTIKGGEGKYIKYEIVQKSLTSPEEYKLLKDGEIYRLGIQFYNRLGQISQPKWIADFKTPVGNLQGSYNTLKVELKSAFTTWLNGLPDDDNKPVGYKIIRAERTYSDKTILEQGIVTSMMFQVKGEEAKNTNQYKGYTAKAGYQDGALKFPTYISRNFDTIPKTYSNKQGVLQPANHLNWVSETRNDFQEGGEIYTKHVDEHKLSQTFQYTKMLQFYSPEILFDITTSIPAGLKLKPKGVETNTENGVYGKEFKTSTKTELFGGRSLGGLNPHHIDSNEYLENNEFRKLFSLGADPEDNNWGFIGPSGEETTMDQYQFYREFKADSTNFEEASASAGYTIYGTPEISERGASSKFYNNDPRYNYSNSLQSILTGGNDKHAPIESVNSYGTRCATIVLGAKELETDDRKGLEDIHSDSGVSEVDGILVTEIVRDSNYAYTGGIYGGNSYEDKLRTGYIEIGTYQPVTTTSVQIDSPGDTFVQKFDFLRIGKTDTEVYSNTQLQLSEVVSCYLETTVDLKNRHDISLSSWDARFQPRDDEFHKYNRVYSQQPNLVKNNPFDFTFRKIKNFDTRVLATKTKIPNETVDSWTDMLENTSLDLDGKYGPINAVVNFKDNLYTFQDNAIAMLGINPRVQTQGNDGIAIELGTGATLYDYNYISTKSGSVNKWGVLATNTGIYYLDGLNKEYFRFDGKGLTNLSLTKGMHRYLTKNIVYNNIAADNPLLAQGVSMGYDQSTNDVYLTYNDGWTLCYNELLDVFTGFYSYNAPIYIYNKEKFLMVNPNDKGEIYQAHAGDYNVFYGTNQPSKLVFLCNPEPDVECSFNNIEWKSEAFNSLDVEKKYTWENIRVYNEFQDSGTRDIDVNNLRKLNRKYRLTLPRNANSTDRIRNTWAYIELTSENASKYRYTNHDIILYYIPNYIRVQ